MAKRIVVKVGSNVLTRDDGKLDVTRMSAIVDQLSWLHNNGYEVILVSSGAVTCGRAELLVEKKLDSVEQRQLYSALGQAKLINLYYDFFREYNIPVAQVLTMKENFASRKKYLNQHTCMRVILENGAIPIVNENDTVSLTELMFTDNDELSGLIASMMDADMLVILSDVDGIYKNIEDEKTKTLVKLVNQETDISQYISQNKSSFGRGGMTTKCYVARKAAEEGIRVFIANGNRKDILKDLILNPKETPHTEFAPSSLPASNIKKWIAHSGSFASGAVHINQKATEALLSEKPASLLPVGITQVEGDFDKGDIINIMSPEGIKIALGRTSYGSKEARQNMGQHGMRPLVHYDYLYIES
ncbi:MAG: glutamate 5-kinase [Prevotella sp.]|nr:glutamate 5-kinase [Prevotella sp.]